MRLLDCPSRSNNLEKKDVITRVISCTSTAAQSVIRILLSLFMHARISFILHTEHCLHLLPLFGAQVLAQMYKHNEFDLVMVQQSSRRSGVALCFFHIHIIAYSEYGVYIGTASNAADGLTTIQHLLLVSKAKPMHTSVNYPLHHSLSCT